jgi:hypothetical protein
VRIALRICAGLFAATWFAFPGFGAVDLTVIRSPDWPQVLEAAAARLAAAWAVAAALWAIALLAASLRRRCNVR